LTRALSSVRFAGHGRGTASGLGKGAVGLPRAPRRDGNHLYGHPTWKARRKTFAVFERYRGDCSVALKAEPDQQRAFIVSDARFYRTPYIGQLGWVSFKLQGRIPWKLLRGLLREAHSSVA
jgi:predicted DNA-binding protein (MmcQ/YjbR family)